jgi:hypothetical protein
MSQIKKKRLTLWRKKIWEDFKKIHKNQLVILEKIQGLIVPYYAKKIDKTMQI